MRLHSIKCPRRIHALVPRTRMKRGECRWELHWTYVSRVRIPPGPYERFSSSGGRAIGNVPPQPPRRRDPKTGRMLVRLHGRGATGTVRVRTPGRSNPVNSRPTLPPHRNLRRMLAGTTLLMCRLRVRVPPGQPKPCSSIGRAVYVPPTPCRRGLNLGRKPVG